MQDLPINLLDAGIILVLLVSGLLALSRGLVKEVLSIGAWIGAGLASLYLFPVLQDYTRSYISVALIADIVTGAAIFVVTLVLLSLVSHAISSRVRDSAVSAVDRSLGFLFGLLRGAVIVCIAWLLLIQVLPPKEQPDWMREAKTIPAVQAASEILLVLLPEETRENALASTREATGESKQLIDSLDKIDQFRDSMTALSPNPDNSAPAANNQNETGYNTGSRQDMENLTRSIQDNK